MAVKYNEQQLEAINSSESKILVLACAGAGKSTTLVSRAARLIKDGVKPNSILCLTFTNKAGAEMSEKFKRMFPTVAPVPEFRTFHAFCYSLIVKDAEIRAAIGYSKIPGIASDAIVKEARQTATLQTKIMLSDDILSGKTPCPPRDRYKLETWKKAYKKYLARLDVITFDIMSEEVSLLFTSKHPSTDKYKNQYKHIMVDEFQDTDQTQFRFVASFKGANWFFVGDALQCQPAGTMVEMASGEIKPIEQIVIGDKVKSYNAREAYYTTEKSGKLVTKTAHHFADNIVEVKSANHSSKYTKEHLTYARIHTEGNEDARCVYLMCNSEKGWWRVGECSLFLYGGSDFGPKHRMHEEGADKVWILDICKNSRESSWYIEQLAAFKFGIPDTTWQFMNVGRYTPETMQELYDNIPDIEDRAKKCLAYFGRDINYPFFNKASDIHRHMSKLHMFELHVGNLIPGLMDIVVPEPFEDGYDAKQGYKAKYHNTYEQITEIIECPPEEVYSLEVDHYHNYIADGILTHNCIYQFRGTNNKYIKMLSEDPEWHKIRMDQNYRSTRQICEFANKMSHYAKDTYRLELKGQRDGLPVTVCTGGVTSFNYPVYQDHMSHVIKHLDVCRDTSAAILCRTNNEVNWVVRHLAQKGIACTNSRKQTIIIPLIKSAGDLAYEMEYLASNLTKDNYNKWIMASYGQNLTIEDFLKMFENNVDVTRTHKKIEKIREILSTSEDAESKAKLILEKFKLLNVSCTPEENTPASIISALVESIESFQESSLYVGTIHSVKGLEYDTVFVLGADQGVWTLDCEDNLNLYYVAITRAKEHLFVYKR